MCCYYALGILRKIYKNTTSAENDRQTLKKKSAQYDNESVGNNLKFDYFPGTFPHEISWLLTELRLAHSMCLNNNKMNSWPAELGKTWNLNTYQINGAKPLTEKLEKSVKICKNDLKLTTISYTGDMYFANMTILFVQVKHEIGKFHWLTKYKDKYFDPAFGSLTKTIEGRQKELKMEYQETGFAFTVW